MGQSGMHMAFSLIKQVDNNIFTEVSRNEQHPEAQQMALKKRPVHFRVPVGAEPFQNNWNSL